MIKIYVKDYLDDERWDELELSNDVDFQLNASLFDPDDRLSYSVDHSFTFDIYHTKRNLETLGVVDTMKYQMIGTTKYALIKTNNTSLSGTTESPIVIKGTITFNSMNNDKYSVSFVDIIKTLFTSGYDGNRLRGLDAPVYRLPLYRGNQKLECINHDLYWIDPDTRTRKTLITSNMNEYISSPEHSEFTPSSENPFTFFPTFINNNENLYDKDKLIIYDGDDFSEIKREGVSNVGFKTMFNTIGDIKTYSLRMGVNTKILFENVSKWFLGNGIEFVYPEIPEYSYFVSGKQKTWVQTIYDTPINHNIYPAKNTRAFTTGYKKSAGMFHKQRGGYGGVIPIVYIPTGIYQDKLITNSIQIRDLNFLAFPLADITMPNELTLKNCWLLATIGVEQNGKRTPCSTMIYGDSEKIEVLRDIMRNTKGRHNPYCSVHLDDYHSTDWESQVVMDYRYYELKASNVTTKYADGRYYYIDTNETISTNHIAGNVYVAISFVSTMLLDYNNPSKGESSMLTYPIFEISPGVPGTFIRKYNKRFYMDLLKITQQTPAGGSPEDLKLDQYWGDDTIKNIIIGYAKLNGWFLKQSSNKLEFTRYLTPVDNSYINNIQIDTYSVYQLDTKLIKMKTTSDKEIVQDNMAQLDVSEYIEVNEVRYPEFYYSYLYEVAPYINTDDFLYIPTDGPGCFVNKTSTSSMYEYCYSDFSYDMYLYNNYKDSLIKDYNDPSLNFRLSAKNYMLQYPDFRVSTNYTGDSGVYKIFKPNNFSIDNSAYIYDRINPSEYALQFSGVLQRVTLGAVYIINSQRWVLVKYEGLKSTGEGTFTFIKDNRLIGE